MATHATLPSLIKEAHMTKQKKPWDESRKRWIAAFNRVAEALTHSIDYVSPEDQRRNDAMERGDELRDRAKDEQQ